MTEKRDDVSYCPVCGRNVFAANTAEVEAGEHESYIFVHDNIVHTRDEVEALGYGIN